MLKKTITYYDFNDVEHTEDFYFNLTEAEVMKMQMTTPGGLSAYINKIVAAQDAPAIYNLFEELIKLAYGEKSLDGKRHMKSDEIYRAFAETEAYSVLLTELATDADAAAAFVNGITPKPKQNKPAMSVPTK